MMVGYHACFDLAYFGWTSWRLLEDPPWIIWRTLILSSFLLLAGYALTLRPANDPARFWKRWREIALAAAAVSAGSALVFPKSFIYFGVLHQMAIALILARACVSLGAWNIALGTGAIIIGAWVSLDALNPKWINWLGGASIKPRTEDYVPLFPWIGVVFLGTGLGAIARPRCLDDRRWRTPSLHPLTWVGRHSLTLYLVHQPILIGVMHLIQRL